MDAPTPPRLTIILALEERPRVVEEAMTEGDSRRLELWVKDHPEYLQLVVDALELGRRAAA